MDFLYVSQVFIESYHIFFLQIYEGFPPYDFPQLLQGSVGATLIPLAAASVGTAHCCPNGASAGAGERGGRGGRNCGSLEVMIVTEMGYPLVMTHIAKWKMIINIYSGFFLENGDFP